MSFIPVEELGPNTKRLTFRVRVSVIPRETLGLDPVCCLFYDRNKSNRGFVRINLKNEEVCV